MNRRYFLHFFLLLAMCFSQTAANVHVVSHLLVTERHGADVDALANHDHHQHLHQHQHHDLSNPEDADAENHLSDCAIYHAYVGMGGLLPVFCDNIAAPRPHLAQSQVLDLALANSSVDTQPIRGPPSRS